MYLHRDALLLPRLDPEGNPTVDNVYHTMMSKDGPRTVKGFMGDDAQAEFFYNLGFFTRGTAVELGSFMGYSSILFALGMKHSPWQEGKLVCVDIFKDDYLGAKELKQTFLDNIEAFDVQDYITVREFMCEDPQAIAFLTEPIEWVYFDASHVWKELAINWDIYYPRVKKGGLLIWHDTHQEDPPKFIEHCQNEYGIVPVITDRPDYQVWMKPLQ